ncbi:M56 family metallopeptidase [Erythrobacter sp.]|jgi:beta-lactamase regulating signal transducer with metallopeptidase domain|uniref:M56 family metallopeptidase n=1 Tax=Erythrobacter sp. TaxID=1042 RepID=UPI002E9BEEAB|nr:M56 family metallopeptidase [Erythrobacter sp.]
MTDWLLETLVWTGVLIAAVLLVRRPVARLFGPQVAYGLWAIPALRLVLPPIELPAWMKPAEAAGGGAGELALLPASSLPVANPTLIAAPPVPLPEAEAGAAILDMQLVLAALLTVWLGGALVFLYRRFDAYFQLRAELLEEGREVGRDGRIRLVETSGTEAPLALGIRDKVIALPPGFLAQPDRRARDLALAHELAHHRAGDLLVNFLVQPLFAIHWWNPLALYGWLALRRDQEAACDARVMADAPREERQAYASLIVSFAAGPNVALAAPMACPVLGDKSIIHRLRSLRMNRATFRRRIAGRLMLGAAVVALPATASISYAASEVPPAPPLAPPAPTAPLAPAAPLASFASQDEALQDGEETGEDAIVIIDPDIDTAPSRWSDPDPDIDVQVDKVETPSVDARPRIFISRDGERISKALRARDDAKVFARLHSRHLGGLSEAELAEIRAEMRESLAEAERVLEDVPEIVERSFAARALAEEGRLRGTTRIEMHCANGGEDVVKTIEREDGTATVLMCRERILEQALNGLKQARNSIAKNREMPADTRREVLRSLDEEIKEMRRKTR